LVRRFLDLPLQANFIETGIYLLDIILKTSALLKQVLLFVPFCYLTITCPYLLYGNMCPLTLASSSSCCTVHCTHSSYIKVPSNCETKHVIFFGKRLCYIPDVLLFVAKLCCNIL